jgi:hypothetical protein
MCKNIVEGGELAGRMVESLLMLAMREIGLRRMPRRGSAKHHILIRWMLSHR